MGSDIGGLQVVLQFIGSIIVNLMRLLFNGSALDRYIVSRLFQVNPRRRDRKTTLDRNKVASRQPAIFSFCNCICSWRDNISRKTYHFAKARANQELDLVTFLKSQMTGGVVQRLLFTRTERYLIRNQANPFAVRRKGVRKEQPTYTDSSDYCPDELKNIENGRYYGQLTANVILSSDDAFKKPKKEKP